MRPRFGTMAATSVRLRWPNRLSREVVRVWILALDASLARCSAAILADGTVVAERCVDGERGHAASLPPLAAIVLAAAGVRATDLDAVAAVVGPGGFTGLRAALALAQGIAVAAGLPIIGVTTGEALAAALHPASRAGRRVWAAIDHRRDRIVLECFAPGTAVALGPPAVFELEALPPAPGPVIVVGDAALATAAALRARGADVVAPGPWLPTAAAAARVAALRLCGRLPPLAARPLYAEPPAVRPPLPAGA